MLKIARSDFDARAECEAKKHYESGRRSPLVSSGYCVFRSIYITYSRQIVFAFLAIKLSLTTQRHLKNLSIW